MTPTNPQADKQCTCTPQFPNLRNGSGHYEVCPLWFPLSTTPLADKLPPIICGACNTKFYGTTAIKECTAHIKTEHSDIDGPTLRDWLTLLQTNDDESIDDQVKNINAAEAAILANYTPNSEVDKIVEAVIGDDLLPPIDDREWDYVKHTNQLRAEQRKRYEALKRGEEQS